MVRLYVQSVHFYRECNVNLFACMWQQGKYRTGIICCVTCACCIWGNLAFRKFRSFVYSISSYKRLLNIIKEILKKKKMQIKKEIVEWFNQQLDKKQISIKSVEELSDGYLFLELLLVFHPKLVDETNIYVKPKDQFDILQNYKLLSTTFAKLGWKSFAPDRYSKCQEKDVINFASFLKKVLSNRMIKEDPSSFFFGDSEKEIKNEEQKLEKSSKIKKKASLFQNTKIMRLQQQKKELLVKIMNIQEEVRKKVPQKTEGQEQNKQQYLVAQLKHDVMQIIDKPVQQF